MKRNLKMFLTALTLALLGGSAAVSAQPYGRPYVYASPAAAAVAIPAPPPPVGPGVRFAYRPACPGPDFVWVDGYWSWAGRRYVWVNGYWARRPYARAFWVGPRWDRGHFYAGFWRR